MAASASVTGFRRIPGRLGIYYKGTLVGQVNASDFGMVGAAATTTLTATTTITAGTGLTVTTGNYTQTASGFHVTAGNLRLGAVSTFATTQPTSCVVMKAGTAAAGAITTSSGFMTDGTTIQKIIADGTVSDIQT
jgi:hypothetical protein